MDSFITRFAHRVEIRLQKRNMRWVWFVFGQALKSTNNVGTGEVKKMKTVDANEDLSAAELISQRIAELSDWRGGVLSRMRKLIHEAVPDVVEEWKWRGTPVWSHNGIICTGETYKKIVKLTFAKGASLRDPARLFNSSLDGNVRRAIDIHENEKINEAAFKVLIRDAATLNQSNKEKTSKK